MILSVVVPTGTVLETNTSSVSEAVAAGDVMIAMATGAVVALLLFSVLFAVLSFALAQCQLQSPSRPEPQESVEPTIYMGAVTAGGIRPNRSYGALGHRHTNASNNSLYGNFFAGSYVDSEPPSPPPEVLIASDCSSDDLASSAVQTRSLAETIKERLAVLQTEMGD